MSISISTRSGSIFLSILLSFMLFLVAGDQPTYAAITKDDCLACHSDKSLEPQTPRGKKLNLFVPIDALKGSVHEDLNCTDCHQGENEKVFDNVPHGTKPIKVECSTCHSDVYDSFIKKDIHGKGFVAGNPRAPTCYSCHGGHQILTLSSPESNLSRMNQPDACGKCHSQEKLNLEDNITKRNLISRYKASVHYQAVKEGKNGATCTDCHSYHNILSSANPDSTVGRTTIANVCQKCHKDEVKTYLDSPHGRTLEHGNNDVPNCTVCHGDHDMASLRTRVGDAKQWAATQVCIWCHGNERIMARYGLDTVPVKSYMEDFHGLTQRGTMGASATCSDCHDAHHSLPSSHPGSRMHLSNRGTTCGKCHGKVSENFSQSFSHRKALQTAGGRIESIVQTIYIIIIACSVGGMIIYNFIVWLWAVRKKLNKQRDEKHVARMTPFERTCHIVMIISFAVLVITGFALKFPEAFWAKWLFAIGMNETVRSIIHRIAGMTMTIDLIVFVMYMFLKKRGKGILKHILPAKRDFTDLFATLKYYLKASRENHHPKYSIFNYGEKFEFWALVWGAAVMLITGLFLWFPKAIPVGWPSWILGVARTIHYFEALLATLAIIIWHGFSIMFHPAEYPMNTSWLTGYITEEEAEHRFEDQAIKRMTFEPTSPENKEK